VKALLPVAERGLAELGVDADEAARVLDVVRARLETDTTPARWQRRVLARLENHLSRREALKGLLERYLDGIASGRPVHEWSET
jgi:hypothetical protein